MRTPPYPRLGLLFLLLLIPSLLMGCSAGANAVPQTTELRYGDQNSHLDVTISGDFSPKQGRWMTFQVHNDSLMPVLLSMDRNFDEDDTVWVDPGETGSLVKELGAFRTHYHFGVNPPNTGGRVIVSYTLTQSTVQPSP